MSTSANPNDEKQHAAAIEALARDLRVRREEVRGVYQALLADIGQTARIKDYLPIFISRKVKDTLRIGKRASEDAL